MQFSDKLLSLSRVYTSIRDSIFKSTGHRRHRLDKTKIETDDIDVQASSRIFSLHNTLI